MGWSPQASQREPTSSRDSGFGWEVLDSLMQDGWPIELTQSLLENANVYSAGLCLLGAWVILVLDKTSKREMATAFHT